jgi:hypothetical protein
MAEKMPEVPSDIVELIIAVDLNPSSPEEPINVNDVQVRDKGGDEGEDSGCPMCDRLLRAISDLDPELDQAIGMADSLEDKVAAVERFADEEPDEMQDEADMFARAQSI